MSLETPGMSDTPTLVQYDPETRSRYTGKPESKATLVISPQVAHISDTIIGKCPFRHTSSFVSYDSLGWRN